MTSRNSVEPIAVIGYSIRFPGDATDSEGLWDILQTRSSPVTDWPEDRCNLEGFYAPGSQERSQFSNRGAYFMKEDPRLFDAPFFSITAQEAASIDPQQRIALEGAYHALENAGIPVEKIRGSKTSVYAGSMCTDHKHLLAKDSEALPLYAPTGTAPSVIANRISYFFDLKGPSVAMDSACSSSLMAVDFACQGLWLNYASTAIVLGSNILYSADVNAILAQMGFLSPDSKCYSFDNRANGYARGEGVGVVILKRLSDAIADNDTIRAVIRSSASNQDGSTPGLTQPSSESQAELIRDTYARAQLNLGSTRYFEAHGHLEGASGIAGLIKTVIVLERGLIPPNANFERLNSMIEGRVKNIKLPTEVTVWPTPGLRRASVNSFGFGGSNTHVILEDAFHHLQARGLNGNIATSVLPLRSISLPSIHCSSTITSNRDVAPVAACKPHVGDGNRPFSGAAVPNGLDLDGTSPDSIVSDGDTLQRPAQDRACANSSLLTRNQENEPHLNGSDVGDKFDPTAKSSPEYLATLKAPNTDTRGSYKRRHRLLVWSAFDEQAARRQAESLTSYLIQHPSINIDDVTYTLAVRRSRMSWRSFAVVDSLQNVLEVPLHTLTPVKASLKPSLMLVFTGQAAQYAGMGLQLLQYATFRTVLETCDSIYRELDPSWSLLEILSTPGQLSHLHEPRFGQPACTALQIALVALLRDLNLWPSHVVGHSSGEIAAAYTVNGLSLRSACKVAFYRGCIAQKAKQSQPASSMLAVSLNRDEMRSFLRENGLEFDCQIACINSKLSTTLSGLDSSMEIIMSVLEKNDVFCSKLRTGVAYHSKFMEPVAPEYAADLKHAGLERAAQPSLPPLTMYSSVTGKALDDLEALVQPSYWVSNLVQPVQFLGAMSASLAQAGQEPKLGQKKRRGVDDVLEVGPHSVLRQPVGDILTDLKLKIRYSSLMSRHQDPSKSLLEAVGQCFSHGYLVDLQRANQIVIQDAIRPACSLTGLPSYPFNHTQGYWDESPLCRNFQFRQHFPSPILGSQVIDWNPVHPKWRKYMDLESMPWLVGHKVNGVIILPATAMIVMALEALRQMVDPNQTVEGFYVAEATFLSPIIIDSDHAQKTEVETFLQHQDGLSGGTKDKFYLNLCSRQVGRPWTDACSMSLQILYKQAHDEVGTVDETHRELIEARNSLIAASHRCMSSVSRTLFYSKLAHMGLETAEPFQNLHGINWDGDKFVMAEISPCFLRTAYQHAIHPALLDSLAQLGWATLTKGGTRYTPLCLPRKISGMYISDRILHGPDTQQLQAFASTTFKPFMAGAYGNVSAIDQGGELVIHTRAVETTTVTTSADRSGGAGQPSLCYSLSLRPDIDLLNEKQLADLLHANFRNGHEVTSFQSQLDGLLSQIIRDIVARLGPLKIPTDKAYLDRYVSWLQRQHKRLDLESTPDIEQAIDHIQALGIQGQVAAHVARNVKAIFSGSVDPVELLFSDTKLEDYYAEIYDGFRDLGKLRSYIDLLAHKNPSMKVLEIGAGYGTMTQFILPLFKNPNDLSSECSQYRLAQYDYTDISEGFFGKARTTFSNSKEYLNFLTFDVERDPESQGLVPGSYDLILAAAVIHATKNIRSSLRNMRKLLKPGGILLLVEVVVPHRLRTGFIFGLLPGWWHNDEERKFSPCLSEDRWNEALQDADFSTLASIPDTPNEEEHEYSVIIARSNALKDDALSKTKENRPLSLAIVTDVNSPLQGALAQSLSEKLYALRVDTIYIIFSKDLKDVPDPASCYFVSLIEVQQPVLNCLTKEEFKDVQSFLCSVRSVLWVLGPVIGRHADPAFSLVLGLMRTLRLENVNRDYTTLSLEQPYETSCGAADTISNLIYQQWNSLHLPPDQRDLEFVEQEGMLCINRVFEERQLHEDIQARIHPSCITKTIQETGPVKLQLENLGTLDSLRWIPDNEAGRALHPGEVEVDVKAIGVNFKDVFVALGRLEADHLGSECSGVVTRTGPESILRPGARVTGCCVLSGHMRSTLRCHESELMPLPEEISFETGAALPIVGITAYYSVVTLARIRPGDSILIHAAAGATGQMCVQIAKLHGAEIFATVGSSAKKDLLIERFGLQEDHVFDSRRSDFAKGIRRLTNGRGVDVVVNSLAGASLVSSWESIAPFGRFIEIGRANIRANAGLPMASFEKNVSFTGVSTEALCHMKRSESTEILSTVLQLIAGGKIHEPYPLTIYPLSNTVDAFRKIQSGKNVGKMVLTVEPSDEIELYATQHTSYRLESDATYIIVGGLGGLGRSIARWFVEKGARHLVLLSRSGPASEDAQTLVDDLVSLGVIVKTPKCDVASSQGLFEVLESIKLEMPPVKGCVQAAMVPKNALFDRMTYDEWVGSLDSKVESSRNLHHAMPSDLDFFILLSSVTSVTGNIGQSNYAAANAYKDALAAHRSQQGLPGISLNLGWMEDIGILAENSGRAGDVLRDEAIAVTKVSERELYGILEYYCKPACNALPRGLTANVYSQTLVGLTTPRNFVSRGLEVPHKFRQRMFSGLARDLPSSDILGADPTTAYRQRFLDAASADDAQAVVVDGLVQKISLSLSIPTEDVDPMSPLHRYGVDSLVAVELRNWLAKEFSADFPIFDIMNATSINELGRDTVARGKKA